MCNVYNAGPAQASPSHWRSIAKLEPDTARLNVRIHPSFAFDGLTNPLQCQTPTLRTRLPCIFNSQIYPSLSFSANSNVILIVRFFRCHHVTSSHNPRLSASQIQLHSVSFHLVLLRPYLLSHRIHQPSLILDHHHQHPRIPIPYSNRMI